AGSVMTDCPSGKKGGTREMEA
ncbi:MAG: hypothetical protein QOF33_4621, partial [Thermomicrobiales bacterium]|nr:hypothetical protein [Thermomicrobiales bacterium]